MPFVRTLVNNDLAGTCPPVVSAARPDINPPARQRNIAPAELVVPAVVAATSTVPEDPPRKPAKKGRPKRHGDGDYDVGYCRPPKEHRFDGSRPGPGRPRGALSQDTIERKHLMAKLPVLLDGKRKSVPTREVAFVTLVKKALGGNDRLLLQLLASSQRLFPPERVGDGPAAPGVDQLDDIDASILADLKATLIAELETQP